MANLKNTNIDDNLELPQGTTAQRPSSPQEGQIRYNTDLETAEFYNGSNWRPLSDTHPEAEGGTVVDTDIGGVPYRIHYFTETGTDTLTVTNPGEVEYLIVAGGGSGGGGGGGGGAGAVVSSGMATVSPGSYTVEVGTGGNKTNNDSGVPGNSSSVFGITSTGGDGGLGGPGSPGSDGANNSDFQGGSGTGTTDSFNSNLPYNSGGGAGSAESPPDATATTGGDGGSGILSSITGVLSFYGGGGGGGGHSPKPPGGFGKGGIGGGGDASQNTNDDGLNGQPNTGGGGGGAYTLSFSSGGGSGGAGGSGIVIVRYPRNSSLDSQPDRTVIATQPQNFQTVRDGLVLELDAGNPVSYPGSGSTWKDLTGNNYDADLSNISFNSFYRALQFNGSSSSARISNIDIPQTEHTILVWLRSDIPLANTTSSGSRKTIFKADNQWRPGLWMTGQIIRPHMPPEFRDKEFPYNPRRSWFQVGQIYNGTNVFTVENGKKTLDDLQRDSYSQNERTTFDIGTESGRGSATWEGQIAIVQIFDKEFSETELQQNFNFYRRKFGI